MIKFILPTDRPQASRRSALVTDVPPEFSRRVLLKALAATSITGCAGEDGAGPSATTLPRSVLDIEDKVAPVYLQLIENDETSWIYASTGIAPTFGLDFKWLNLGGDWRDSANVQNGSTHYATATVNNYGSQDVVFGVTALATRLLTNNTGIHVRQTTPGTGSVDFSTRTGAQAPMLQIVTNTGTFNCPCTVSFGISRSAQGSVLGTTMQPTNALLKFNLSAVTGTVTSATMTLRLTDAYVGTFPRVFAANYLDMPRLYYAPAVEVGGVVQGIANSVAQDNLLGSHPSVLCYDDLTSDAVFFGATRRYATVNLGTGGRSYEALPKYGLTALVVTSSTSTPHIVDAHRWSQPMSAEPEPNSTWHRGYTVDQELGHTHLFFRYMMWIGEDLYAGFNTGGIKLSGMYGSYEWSSSGAPTVPEPHANHRCIYRATHSTKSAAAPHFYQFGTYEYDCDRPLGVYSGVARSTKPNIVRGACLRAGRWYCLEQELKLNTLVGNGAPGPLDFTNVNADGIERWWIDGVLVYEFTNLRCRGVKHANIQSIPKLEIYHGGTTPPSAPFTYKMAGVCVSTQYIGPPKVIA